jgi:hypothetical protein
MAPVDYGPPQGPRDKVAATMDEANPTSDRYFDLSLRLLTIFVLVSLVACVAFLSYRWLSPRFFKEPTPPVETHNPVVVSPAPTSEATPAPTDKILMDPRKTFRCVEQGRVTFSDRACDTGSEQILPLNAPQPPPAGGR